MIPFVTREIKPVIGRVAIDAALRAPAGVTTRLFWPGDS